MKRSKNLGFSLLEVLAAVVILAVVATAAIGTVAPLRKRPAAEVVVPRASLDAATEAFRQDHGRLPERLDELVSAGYLLGPVEEGDEQ